MSVDPSGSTSTTCDSSSDGPGSADEFWCRGKFAADREMLEARRLIDYRRYSMNETVESLDRDQATQWASWFQALGDPTRVLILHVLSNAGRPMSVGEITDALDVGQSTVSHHLAKLAEVRFVLVEHVSTSSRWRVNSACLAAFPSAAEMVMGRVPTEFTEAMECNR